MTTSFKKQIPSSKITAKIYPASGVNPTVANSDSSKANLAFCFSGGGSRALTCGWGQMLGLKTQGLLDKPRYISSVSGGTWATSIYNFLPEKISTTDLLGAYYSPADLSLTAGAGKFDVNGLSQYSLGRAPAGMKLDDLITKGLLFLLLHPQSDHKWMWAYIVGELVLEPYGLRSEGSKSWNSSKHFTLSEEYAKKNFPTDAPSINDFYFLRSGRPFHVMNDNIMEKVVISGKSTPNIIQIPNQITPVATGARGQNTVESPVVGGGAVESYGYNSNLDKSDVIANYVDITIEHTYSLIDAVSTSSAFFAETLASLINTRLSNAEQRKTLLNNVEAALTPIHKKSLLARIKQDFEDLIEAPDKEMLEKLVDVLLKNIESDGINFLSVVPAYNYWPIGGASTNKETQYTDGGTLENTGVLGIISQTDTGCATDEVLSLVVFDNPAEPFTKKGDFIDGAGQIARLFGLTEVHEPYTAEQKDPTNLAFTAASLTAVFDNSPNTEGKTPFDNLLQGLYESSCNGGDICSNAPYYQLELTTITNPLANVTAGRKINMFFTQNAKMMNWQNALTDTVLQSEIVAGQKSTTSMTKEVVEELLGKGTDFDAFPYYSTFTKIGLKAKESNALSQMWAWAVADDASPLKSELAAFINSAE